MSPEFAPDEIVDALGVLCPEPMLRARRVLEGMAPGGLLAVTADDPMAEIDLRIMCERTGHELVAIEDRAQGRCFFIRKGSTGNSSS